MFVVGFDTPTIERTMELIDKYDSVYGIIGWHLSLQRMIPTIVGRGYQLIQHEKFAGVDLPTAE